MNLYELQGVERAYRDGSREIRALDHVDLALARGEFVAIEGPSGSGKSTLLQLLGALDRPTAGSLVFDSQDLTKLDDGGLTRVRSREIGFVFQSFNLIPTLNAAENIETAMVPLGHKMSALKSRAAELLERVGLGDRATHLPSKLSGGEQQRVAIARALANEPRVILADEPTGNLDSATSEEVVRTLQSLATEHGVTVIVVTHSEEVARYAARRVLLRDGRVVGDSQAASFAAEVEQLGS